MLLDEGDIDFIKLSPSRFEELCFDLLRQLGFYNLIWRQGGADQGRDIEAVYNVTNPLVGTSSERWFIECKNLATGVSVEDIASKLAWADAERPKYLVIITSSYLTSGCRQWLDKQREFKHYQIHIIEGKVLKRLLLGYREIVQRYFIDGYDSLLRDAIRQWFRLGILPGPEQLFLLSKNLNPSRLTPEELAFLWCAWQLKKDEIDNWIIDNEEFSFESYLPLIEAVAINQDPVLSGAEDVQVLTESSHSSSARVLIVAGQMKMLREEYPHMRKLNKVLAQLILSRSSEPRPGLYCYLETSVGSAIEVLVEGNLSLSSSIRNVRGNIEEDQKRAFAPLR